MKNMMVEEVKRFVQDNKPEYWFDTFRFLKGKYPEVKTIEITRVCQKCFQLGILKV